MAHTLSRAVCPPKYWKVCLHFALPLSTLFAANIFLLKRFPKIKNKNNRKNLALITRNRLYNSAWLNVSLSSESKKMSTVAKVPVCPQFILYLSCQLQRALMIVKCFATFIWLCRALPLPCNPGMYPLPCNPTCPVLLFRTHGRNFWHPKS